MESHPKKTTLFTGGINPKTQSSSLKKLIVESGIKSKDVLQIRIPKKSGPAGKEQTKSIAFIDVSSRQAADRIISHFQRNRRFLDGRHLTFDYSNKSHADKMRKLRMRLFMKSIPPSITNEQIETALKADKWEVRSAYQILDSRQKPRGFGFIDFYNEGHSRELLRKGFFMVNGHRISLNPYTPGVKDDFKRKKGSRKGRSQVWEVPNYKNWKKKKPLRKGSSTLGMSTLRKASVLAWVKKPKKGKTEDESNIREKRRKNLPKFQKEPSPHSFESQPQINDRKKIENFKHNYSNIDAAEEEEKSSDFSPGESGRNSSEIAIKTIEVFPLAKKNYSEKRNSSSEDSKFESLSISKLPKMKSEIFEEEGSVSIWLSETANPLERLKNLRASKPFNLYGSQEVVEVKPKSSDLEREASSGGDDNHYEELVGRIFNWTGAKKELIENLAIFKQNEIFYKRANNYRINFGGETTKKTVGNDRE